MITVQDFISELQGNQLEIIRYLHQMISSASELQPKIRFKIPFYYGKSWTCYLNPIKDDSVELVFIRGNELSNDQGLLDSRGRKQVSGIILQKTGEIPDRLILEVLNEAIILDKEVPYSSPGKRKPGE